MQKTVIGVDFGTESGRAVVVDVRSGAILAAHVTPYPHGVLDEVLPTGEQLGDNWALQHPEDYLTVLKTSIPKVLQISKVSPETVIGIGIDFTSCTMLPVNAEGAPLCLLPMFEHRPHSWPKLWKHHSAAEEAQDVTQLAAARQESFLPLYGGAISTEWMIPKILQVLRSDPKVYEASNRFVEAGDWVTAQLTGNFVRNRSAAGFKAMWTETGPPDSEFFAELDPRLQHIMCTKLRGKVVPVGSVAGHLVESLAQATGLCPGIPVAAAAVDAFAAVPGAGVAQPGTMVLAMGTSTCHMVLSEELHMVEGITGVVKDGILPSFYGYEAGQAAVGDIFNWFLENMVPDSYIEHARANKMSVFDLLETKASDLTPGESGLVALDWWNGNRSILGDAHLSGMMVGLTLSTKTEEMYRALIEATAFGTRKIVERFVESGVEINKLVACGGLPGKNKMLMQIYADVTGRKISTPAVDESTALGAAILAAASAGLKLGGYDSVTEAIHQMSPHRVVEFHPIQKNVERYNELYEVYCVLHDTFGQGSPELMHRLRKLRELTRKS
ncbi:ribulokinase [Alicyclobacillus sp. SO9]|uniref:ribulokinase n=1 Tax=Alicyclobacillus sp. SO9 TaxID=2665646 RepID=UPI00351C9121